MILLLVVLLISISLCTLWCWWLRIIKNGSSSLMTGCIPIIGHTHLLIGNTEKLWNVIHGWSYETLANGDIKRLIIALQTYYIITDPEDMKTAGNYCLQKHFSFDFAKPWLGDGLVTGTPSIWKRHRKLINPTFTLQLMHGFLNVFNAQTRELVENLAGQVDQGPVDISCFFRENAMKVLSQTALGLSDETVTSFFQKYIKAADETLELIVTRFQNFWLHSNLGYKLTGLKKKETDLIKVLNNMSDIVIEKRRTKLAKVSNDSKMGATSPSKHKVFLDLLLEFSEDGTWTDKEIREEVDSIIVAGTDTSSWLVTYICVAVGSYPDVQQKMVDEVTQIFGDSDRDVDKDDLQRLVYIEAVIKETLRLYPVAPISVRTLTTGVQLKNHYLRPGEHVFMSFYGVNRHPMWGPDADQFKPERWLQPTILQNLYGGFGVGKRNCLGKTYAMLSMKILLAHLLRRYHFSADITKLKLKMDFISKPICGHLVALSERNGLSKSR